MTETEERVEDRLADFTRDKRMLLLAAMAVVIGAISAVVAKALVDCSHHQSHILSTLFFRLRFTHKSSSRSIRDFCASDRRLIIGLMARYGSEKIRGHGIPEALEAILFGRSRMDVKVAVLKPLSSAISIGSGGPFGAEGPIIMTGGAIGSANPAGSTHSRSSDHRHSGFGARYEAGTLKYLACRSGFAARCEAGLGPAGSPNKIQWGCAPGTGLALLGQRPNWGHSPNSSLLAYGGAKPRLTSGGKAGAAMLNDA